MSAKKINIFAFCGLSFACRGVILLPALLNKRSDGELESLDTETLVRHICEVGEFLVMCAPPIKGDVLITGVWIETRDG